jgi:hypothetical protein
MLFPSLYVCRTASLRPGRLAVTIGRIRCSLLERPGGHTIVVSGVRSRGIGGNGCNAFVGGNQDIVFMTLTLPSSSRLVTVPSIITVAENVLSSSLQIV